MQVELKEEHEDGSATFNITYNATELEHLINFAVNRMLEESMNNVQADLFSAKDAEGDS